MLVQFITLFNVRGVESLTDKTPEEILMKSSLLMQLQKQQKRN